MLPDYDSREFRQSLPDLLKHAEHLKLWFVNNALSLGEGYQYLHRSALITSHFMRAFCLFRQDVADKIEEFSRDEDVLPKLLSRVNDHEPLFAQLHDGSNSKLLLSHYLQTRVNEAALWIRFCRYKYRTRA